MTLELAERSQAQLGARLERLRAQAGVEEAVVITATGRLIASASDDVTRLVPELPSRELLRQARANRGYTAVDSVAGRPLSLRVVLPLDGRGLAEEARFLQLRNSVPGSFGKSAEAVEAAYRDYRELAISRDGLKRIYVVTLSFALLMALFVAVAVAVTQSNLLAEPLANLAQATQAVARGDFSRPAPVTSRDELGVLTESFNSMTRQLEEARRGVEANRAALEAAKAHLENILANLSAGVLVYDHELELTISNHGARAIAGGELDAFVARMRSRFVEEGAKDWQLDVVLKDGKTVHARGARLPLATGGGLRGGVRRHHPAHPGAARHRLGRGRAAPRPRDQESADPDPAVRRAAADEARRAPRARRRRDAAARDRAPSSTRWPRSRRMVDDFRDYARLPAPAPARLDLNALVARGARALRELARAHPEAPRRGPAAGVGRRRANPPGDPQPGPERAGRVGEYGVEHGSALDRGAHRACGRQGASRGLRQRRRLS